MVALGNETASFPPEIVDDFIIDKDYYFADGNIRVLANKKRMFCVHKFKLEPFSKLRTMTSADRKNRLIDVPDSPEDMYNTFELIYSCPLEPPKFGVDVLISALRIATTYDHPKLRRIAIQRLEEAGLPCFEHISLARDYNVPGWETMILDQLVARANPITLAEGQVLGMDLVVSLAARRESKKLAPPQPTSQDDIIVTVGSPKRKESESWRRFPVERPRDYPAPRAQVAAAMRSKSRPSKLGLLGLVLRSGGEQDVPIMFIRDKVTGKFVRSTRS